MTARDGRGAAGEALDAFRQAARAVDAAEKRRDVLARMMANTMIRGEIVDDLTLAEYTDLVDEVSSGWVSWQQAYDRWAHLSGLEQLELPARSD